MYNLQVGRSSYVRAEEVAKTPDPGAMAAAQWLRAAAQSLSTWKCNCKDPSHVIDAPGWVLLEGPILQLWDEQLTQFVSMVHQAFEATTHYVQNNIHDRVLEKRWFRLSPFPKTREDSHTQQLLPCNCIFWHLCNNNLLKSFSYFTHLGLAPKAGGSFERGHIKVTCSADLQLCLQFEEDEWVMVWFCVTFIPFESSNVFCPLLWHSCTPGPVIPCAKFLQYIDGAFFIHHVVSIRAMWGCCYKFWQCSSQHPKILHYKYILILRMCTDLTSGSHVGFESTITTFSLATFAYEMQVCTFVSWNPLLSFI